jgi:hypothetical protein
METNFWSVFPVVGCNPIVIISRVVGKRFDSFTLHQVTKATSSTRVDGNRPMRDCVGFAKATKALGVARKGGARSYERKSVQ